MFSEREGATIQGESGHLGIKRRNNFVAEFVISKNGYKTELNCVHEFNFLNHQHEQPYIIR
jgi:hypothetical protein